MIPATSMPRLSRALPYWASLGMIPLAALGAALGGWWVVLLPMYGWVLFAILDAVTGEDRANADPETPEADLFWYRLITLIWVPMQAAVLFGMIWYATRAPHLDTAEILVLFFGVGIISGTVGINYAHELMHQKPGWERWLGDLLLAMVLYSHFRSEHLRVHHAWVGTPRDPVTARYNEGFHRFFARVLWQCPASAYRAELALLARLDRPAWHIANPFWRYLALQLTALALAYGLGGWAGVWLFAFQAFVAIWQLELVNYIEHYGLTRRHLGDGRYEHVKPHHSWNAAQCASNRLLINLQRHSDHHYKPDRRFPLLQHRSAQEAPQLPRGYLVMTVLAMIPPLWRRRMNPRVRAWRKRFYPDITDWATYNRGANPLPSGIY